MDDRYLVFKTVADKKSFSQAAKVLHLSQPAISLQIQSLEEFYGTKLFDRTNKRVLLTEAGRILYEFVEQATQLHEQAKKSIAEATGIVKGKLHLGATLTIGEYLIPKVIGLFVQDHPNVNFSMEIANTELIMQKLLDNNLELGVIEGPVDHPNLIKEEFQRDELVIIAPPSHPWAKRKTISLNDFIQEPLILREPGSGTRMVMAAKLKELGIEPGQLKMAMELGSTQAVKEAVLCGIGVSIVSSCTIQRELKFGLLKIVRIKDVQFPRALNIFYNKNKFRTRTVEAFLELLHSSAVKKILDVPLD